ncbi:hypothetical protein BDV23DRAFT_151734 [Aspergillus alliaceus]|uniref:Uncharacterized protein n=1 Tax=Petromyces alliaceus TaxID=209559 RepID=A0A5N7CE87_PETAA|nr:hypothetical protein BDV23DRAFT_151734 [Aspergillus alliaceus]
MVLLPVIWDMSWLKIACIESRQGYAERMSVFCYRHSWAVIMLIIVFGTCDARCFWRGS